MKKLVYIESSVISFLTAKPSRDLIIAAYQRITRDWWDTELQKRTLGLMTPVICTPEELIGETYG